MKKYHLLAAVAFVALAACTKNGQTNVPAEIDTATTIVTKDNMYEPECQKILFPFNESKE